MRIGEKMSLHNFTVSFFVTCWFSLFSVPIAASESSEQIQTAVGHFLLDHEKKLIVKFQSQPNTEKRIETQMGNIDSRLGLKACQAPLTVKLRNDNKTTGRLTTKVSCSTGSMWSLYVPVTIHVFQTVAVANTPIPRGTSLQAHHLRLDEKNISTLYRGYYPQTKSLLGLVTKRAIRTDDVIDPQNVSEAKIVQRDEEVTIIANIGGLKVRAAGIALSDGILGENISVRNKNTNKVIEARVKGPGKVEIQI